MDTTKQCNRCKQTKCMTQFNIKKNKTRDKICTICLEKQKNIPKCEHNISKNKCRKCMSLKQLIRYTLRTMINHGKHADIKYKRYNKEKHVNLSYLKNMLVTKYINMNCYYCCKKMSFNPQDKYDLITLERIDNDIGHVQSNVQFCCLICNKSKIGTTSKCTLCYHHIVQDKCVLCNKSTEQKQCCRCKQHKPVHQFKQQKFGDLNKQCKPCSEKEAIYITCIHNKYKHNCTSCSPHLFCKHNKYKIRCRHCMPPETLIPFTFKNMIRGAKHSDNNKSMFDEVHFINIEFLKELLHILILCL